ncbi:MAG: tetratricopeptide repeat protein [Chloroflexi bacterium]|nr:tetratricopeptide repeat protein [Chloroflexota bacterium]
MKYFLTKHLHDLLVWGALMLILVVGGAFRFQALDWDQGQWFHPDERAIVNAVITLNKVVTSGDPKDSSGPRRDVQFPYNGLGFFMPDGADIRPATPAEAQLYRDAQLDGNTYSLPPNVVLPNEKIPDKAFNFWNAAYSPLNPHFFAYGSLPMYLIKFSGDLMTLVTGENWGDYGNLMLVGRFLAVLWSLGTIILVFLLGRRAFGPVLGQRRGEAIGLLAAAFLAVSVLDIQLAHYLTFDVPLTFFITLVVYVAIGHMRTGTRWSAVRTGLAVGLALACKISAAPVVMVAVIAALLYGLYGSAKHSGEQIGRPQTKPLPNEVGRYLSAALVRRLLGRTLVNLLLIGLATLVAWFVTMPYAFIDFTSWSTRVIEEAGMSRGIADLPYTRQYIGTIPFLYQAGNLVQWGLGWPLGVLALSGLAFGLWRLLGRRFKAEVLLYSWLIPYILITFTSEVKFNRYMLPILPILIILAARLIVEKATSPKAQVADDTTTPLPSEKVRFYRRLKGVKLRVWVAAGLTLFTFGWTTVWAISFSQIYSQEQPMTQASRWMYQNMPVGASYTTEMWDEGMPRLMDSVNFGSKNWRNIPLDIYGDASNYSKVQYFISQFKEADYIIISSNRLYATMPKLPWRYPVQIRYYELLFSEKLGYKQVATFTDYPTIPLLDIPINDDKADESFTVYDHPKVMIFKKTQQFTDEQYNGLFANSVKAPQIPRRQVTSSDLPQVNVRNGDGALDSTTAGLANYYDIKDGNHISTKSLLLDKPVDQLPTIDDIGWFTLANENQWLAVLVWYLLAQVLGLLGLPLLLRACRRLPDRGYILAKPVGAMVVALVIWVLVWTQQVMNTVSTAYIALTLVALGAAWVWWRNRTEIFSWLSQNRKLILIEELVFVVAFGVWLLVRIGNPDLWHPYFGGEKPMEFTHLNGILHSPYFPPYDPWFSDGYINYYYYGQYIVATWIKLTGITPSISFNLALPLLYGFVCAGGFSLAFNLAQNYRQHRIRETGEPSNRKIGGPVGCGLFGMFIFAVAGNFDGFIQILQRFQVLVDLANFFKLYPETAQVVTKFDYFRSTRIIGGTNISEFPYFSFLYGDLHAHLINLPFTLVALALALNLVSTDWSGYDETDCNVVSRVALRLNRLFDGTFLLPLLLAALLGLLAATNIWDLPTYFGIITVAFFLGLFRRPPTPSKASNLLDAAPSVDTASVDDAGQIKRLRPRFDPLGMLLDAAITVIIMGGILALSYAFYWNFFSHYQALYGEIATTRNRSPLLYWLVIFILPIFILISYLIWSYASWLKPGPKPTSGLSTDDNKKRESVSAIQLTLPGFNLQWRRPELAFSLGGTEGGYNYDSIDLGEAPPPRPNPKKPLRINWWAVPWLLLLLLGLVGFGITALIMPDRLVTVLGLLLTFAALFLIVMRSFDPDPAQADEARQPQNLFLRLLIVTSMAVVAGVETVYLVDDLSGSDSLHRMNTVFKFYYQVWTMLTLATAFAAYILWTRWVWPKVGGLIRGGSWRIAGRLVWLLVAVFLVGSVSIYPILAAPGKWSERSSTPLPPATLDGLAYFDNLREVRGMPNMERFRAFDMKYEAQSLHEFYQKISGTPVVMQISIWPYRGGGSWISINTGLPTVLGWDHHETQQRYSEQIFARSEEGAVVGCVRDFYNTPDIGYALKILNHYHVTYVHLGVIERDGQTTGHSAYTGGPDENCLTSRMYNAGGDIEPLMSEEGFNKFDKMVKLGLMEVAYQNLGVMVYKLTSAGEAGVVEGDPNTIPSDTTSGNDPKLNRLLEAVNRSPSDAQIRYDLANYYFQRQNYEKAVEQMVMVVQLRPTEVNPYHILGDFYMAMGDKQKALETWKQPTIIAPTVPAAFNKYGLGLQGVGRYDEAVEAFKTAIKLNPSFEEAYFHIGECYEALNRTQDALQAYQQTASATMDVNSFWLKRASQRVQALLGKK